MRCLSQLLSGLLIGLATLAPAQAQVQTTLALQPRADNPGLLDLSLQLRDGLSQQPLSYAPRRLAAWLQKPLASLSEGEQSCSDKVRQLASPGVGRRAVVDFNAHRLMAINADRSVTVINPFVRLNQAKLEDVITLPGDVHAVLHRPQAHEVWLALGLVDQVVVLDTDTRRVKQSHQLAAGSRPAALLDHAGAVWVAQAGRPEWLKFADGSSVPDRLAAAPVHDWLAVPGQALPWGVSANGLVRPDSPAGSGLMRVGGELNQVVWSPLAQRALLGRSDGQLLWLDLETGRAARHLNLGAAVTHLAVFAEGRYLLATAGDQLHVIDVATAQTLQRLALDAPVSEISFSDKFAYLHSASTARLSLLALADLRQGLARPVQVAVGSPVQLAEQASSASMSSNVSAPVAAPARGASRLRLLPEAHGMYMANPADGQIYQYTEGMMAPIGSFTNYRRSPVALLLLDDGLQAVGPGDYRAVLRTPPGGTYEVVLSGVQPRFADCRMVQVAASSAPITQANAGPPGVKVKLLSLQRQSESGPWQMQVQLLDAQTGQGIAGVADLTLLAFDKQSGWQTRLRMQPAADGLYQAALTAPASARLDLRLGSVSRELAFHAGGLGTHQLDGGNTP